MFDCRLSLKLLMSICLCLFAPQGNAAEPQSGLSIFEEYNAAKTLILTNCYDCIGADSDELLRGIETLERLVGSGFRVREALELLADSTRDYALTEYERHSEVQVDALLSHSEIYRELIESNPKSIDLLAKFVGAGSQFSNDQDLDRLIALSERVLAETYYVSGVRLLREQSELDRSKAIQRLQAAYDIGDRSQKKLFGNRLASELEASGRSAEATAVLQEISRLR